MEYSIFTTSSGDGASWLQPTSVWSAHRNLEDLRWFQEGTSLSIIFEEEEYDHGPSKIQKLLLPPDSPATVTTLFSTPGDNEHAGIIQWNGSQILLISSDFATPGRSYDGASVYLVNQSPGDLLPIKIPSQGGTLIVDGAVTKRGALRLIALQGYNMGSGRQLLCAELRSPSPTPEPHP